MTTGLPATPPAIIQVAEQAQVQAAKVAEELQAKAAEADRRRLAIEQATRSNNRPTTGQQR